MIYLYSGTPGSGKSLHTARMISDYCNSRRDRLIFTNFEVNPTGLKHPERLIYIPNKELSVSFLEDKALSFFRIINEKRVCLFCFWMNVRYFSMQGLGMIKAVWIG